MITLLRGLLMNRLVRGPRADRRSFNFTDAVNRDAVEQAIASAWQAIDESRVPAPELSPAN